MNLLVTGGAGFIGSNFILYWMREHPDDVIVNYDKMTYAGNTDNLLAVKDNPKYHFIKNKDIDADICDMKDVVETMKKFEIDTIVHFAAQSHVDRSVMLREKNSLELHTSELFTVSRDNDFIINNVWGTHVLLEAAVQIWKNDMKGKRFHHISTDEVYGALKLEDTKKFDEKTLYNPRSPYSASKAASDHLVNAYHVTFNLPTTITNTSNNYGPYQYPEKLIPIAILNVLEGKKVPIYGDGKYVRDWLYVDDHARGIDLVLSKGKVGETYCIGGLTDDVNNLELIKRMLKIMGKGEEMLEFIKDRPGHDRRYAIDWTKAKNELGYKPLHDIDTYLEKTIQWYTDNEKWWRKILDRKDHQEYLKKQYDER
ncbi:MAG TPA: dTDP-glucose 4,6-dehydratase [Desulfobacterales bacterium]|nr:dTDP-glucose 4,6-dehydratase [Desulfobacterales bacterium]